MEKKISYCKIGGKPSECSKSSSGMRKCGHCAFNGVEYIDVCNKCGRELDWGDINDICSDCMKKLKGGD